MLASSLVVPRALSLTPTLQTPVPTLVPAIQWLYHCRHQRAIWTANVVSDEDWWLVRQGVYIADSYINYNMIVISEKRTQKPSGPNESGFCKELPGWLFIRDSNSFPIAPPPMCM